MVMPSCANYQNAFDFLLYILSDLNNQCCNPHYYFIPVLWPMIEIIFRITKVT